MSATTAFLIGTGGSLAAALILWLVKSAHIPLLNWAQSDDISGEWISEYEEEDEEEKGDDKKKTYTERIHIRQAGSYIRGSAALTEAGKPVERQQISGTYKNQILTAQYWSTEKGVIERGTFTLEGV